MQTYDSKKEWLNAFSNHELAYPSEYVIRILKGNYPNLNLDKNFKEKKFLDMGCGDGRNLILAKSVGFDIYGVEIDIDICKIIEKNLENAGINKYCIKEGKNDNIPFESNFFDYMLSWNSCYYMGG